MDVSEVSLAAARRAVDRACLANVELRHADIFALPFTERSFDHVFVCFVLEHLPQPARALALLHRLLKPGGTLTIIEGDHGSTYFHPHSTLAHAAIHCQVVLQARAGGSALIGRKLYPLMVGAGFDKVRVSPRMVYVDSSRPHLVEGFTKKTFIAMIEGVRAPAIAAGLTTARSSVPAFEISTAQHRPTASSATPSSRASARSHGRTWAPRKNRGVHDDHAADD